jgi:hypothetical protein
MKRLTFGVLMLAGLLAACDKAKLKEPHECVPVTYQYGICGKAVLKIENSAYYDLGENVGEYENSAYYDLGENVGEHENVFLATLECFTDENALKNKVFFVQINPADFNQNCAVCFAAVVYNGSKHYNVRVSNDCTSGVE